MNSKVKVILAISGGVDSSVCAYLLKKNGYAVRAVFMKNWDEDDGTEFCTAKQDYQDAQMVCDQLKIKLNLINFSAEYYDEVFADFLTEIKRGNTPNPDILCNQKIKFGYLQDYANSLGADYLATGHYAKIKPSQSSSSGFQLLMGEDKTKDQSYFLYAINPNCLKKTLFPLADIKKTKVREIAKKLNLPNAKKKDSTGICFIGERNFSKFLAQYIKSKKGKIINLDTQDTVGVHSGLENYTIGQRKGLGIGGSLNNQPWFVVKKDLAHNELIVVQGGNHPALYHQRLIAGQTNWFCNIDISKPYQAKIRYRQSSEPCRIVKLNRNIVEVVFNTPQRAMTIGQSVVIYNKNECLGGGIITQYFKN